MFFSNNKQDKKKILFYFPLEITFKIKTQFMERLGNIFLKASSNAIIHFALLKHLTNTYIPGKV